MTEERRLLYLHKLLHEQAKHKQGDMKDIQTEQVRRMRMLLGLLEIEDGFARFVKTQDGAFLAEKPNTCPGEEELQVLKAMDIRALKFPCVRVAQNGKSAKGMWLAETPEGDRPIAAAFAHWGDEWRLWKLNLAPTTDDLPYEPYERSYPDPAEKPSPAPAPGGPGGPGGPPPGGPGGPPPAGGPGPGPDGPPPMGGPGGEDQPPFDPDARSDVFDLEGDFARLSGDMEMLTKLALPDYVRGCQEAEALLDRCRRVVTPEYAAQRVRRSL